MQGNQIFHFTPFGSVDVFLPDNNNRQSLQAVSRFFKTKLAVTENFS
jgi:hypothetical protein